MRFSRRRFIQSGLAAASVGLAAAQDHQHQEHHHGGPLPVSRPMLKTTGLAPFVDRLPLPLRLAASGTRLAPGSRVQVPYYHLGMREVHAKVHRDLPATRFWSFGSSFPGPLIEAHKGKPVLVQWTNNLPAKHFLPIDHSLHGAEASLPEVRAVVHLHGAKVPPESDGYPEQWYVPGKSQTVFYPNDQDAAMLWYHDHTMGINRLNVFAGLLGPYMLRDAFEASLNLPAGEFEIPLILCDRNFDDLAQLNYPVSPKPDTPWIPEFFGETMLVNGKLSPFAELKAGQYRLRILNACNARFLSLTLSSGQEFVQIGSDQGLLAKPVNQKSLEIAPGERFDVIVDFAPSSGTRIELRNGAAPIMQFRVAKTPSVRHFAIPTALRPIARIPESDAIRTRLLTLDEIVSDENDEEPVMSLLNNSHWHDPVTEQPVIDTTEIWSLVNTTDDTHPIHLHLVRFQVLDRQPFHSYQYADTGKLEFTGPPIPPEPGEEGWKDTVRAFGQMVTRIIVKFEGYTGRYVWHCHILEHEDNDMMRPYDVLPR